MPKAIHPVAGALALLTILTFWVATLVSEAFGPTATVVTVKTLIPWGFILLIPALMAAGGSGFALAKERRCRLVDTKRKRMPVIALNGILILIPSAFFLAFKAQAGELDLTFYGVQLIELVAGAVNITLLGLNMRDGFRLTGRLQHRAA